MNQTRFLTASLLILAALIIGFLLSVPHTRDIVRETAAKPVSTGPKIILHDVFKKNTHTILGSVLLPDVCTTVTATASLGTNGLSQAILVDLAIPEETQICLQLPTTVTFSVKINAPDSLPIQTSINGVIASSTVQ